MFYQAMNKEEMYYDAKEDNFVGTFDGEFKDSDINLEGFSGYGIQVGSLTISNIKPEIFLKLAREMTKHLETNGRKVKI